MDLKSRFYSQSSFFTSLEKTKKTYNPNISKDAISSAHKLKSIPSLVSSLDLIADVFQPHTIACYAYDPIANQFDLLQYQSRCKAFLEVNQKPEGIFQLSIKLKRPAHIHGSNRLLEKLELYGDEFIPSSLWMIPILRDEVLMGTLVMSFKELNLINNYSRRLLNKFSLQVLKDIQYHSQRQKNSSFQNELSLLVESNAALNKCFRLEEVGHTLLYSAKRLLKFEDALILLKKNSNELHVCSESLKGDSLKGFKIDLSESKSILSWCLNNQTPLYYPDFCEKHQINSVFPSTWAMRETYESILIQPLCSQEDQIGVVVYASQKKDAFSLRHRKIVELLGQHAASSFKNAQMVEMLEQLATTDGLTGLTNHRHFQERLAQEIERCDRYGQPVSLLLLDIDHFKKFNDTYGHPIGDHVLKCVAKKLQNLVRSNDMVARYGGEEFVVMLTNTPSEQAFMLAERIRIEIEAMVLEKEGLELQVTCSFGVSSYPQHAANQSILIKKADIALYASKEKGRNCCSLFDREMQDK